ncbi:Hypothetical predicted protein [Paramuricea clavata]|uniref:Uncharacterized protein n=1 Tax=Paramuricea clavata TaxID=317549 RepID=A0A6S7KIF6_PARCT|nr:Hypothetical predicted protein [Paramuricea clavata]
MAMSDVRNQDIIRSKGDKSKPSSSEKKKDKASKEDTPEATTTTLVATSSAKGKNKNKNKVVKEKHCCFCEGSHPSLDCKKNRPADSYQRLWKAKVCTTCLMPGHMTRYCKTKKACGVSDCTWKHHPSLHAIAYPERDRKD